MTRRNRANLSSLFLLELIIAIMFFSIASAVCVQFFVKSHLLSESARELNISVNEVSSTAELILSSKDLKTAADSIHSEYPDAVIESNSIIIVYYDKNFLPCTKKDAVYCLNINFTQKDYLLDAALTMTNQEKDNTIYSLNLSHHIQRRSDDE
jgi:type II secretory pathway component PulJ